MMIFENIGNNPAVPTLYARGRPSDRLQGGAGSGNCFWKRNATMKNLLMALVAVGLMVGCGGDTAATGKTTKTEVKTTTPAGTTKTETTKKEETKTTTDKDKK